MESCIPASELFRAAISENQRPYFHFDGVSQNKSYKFVYVSARCGVLERALYAVIYQLILFALSVAFESFHLKALLLQVLLQLLFLRAGLFLKVTF